MKNKFMDYQEVGKIVWAYNEVIQKSGESGHFLRPESKLPYSREEIGDAIKIAINNTKNETMKENLKDILIFLDDFIPDNEVPSDRTENIIECVRRQNKFMKHRQ